MIPTSLRALAALGLAATLGACLDDQAAPVDCGAGGDAFRFSSSDYCIYTGAIIIEGFDCPANLPFGHETDGVMICGPTSDAPPEGWDALVDAWEDAGNPLPGGTDAPDTNTPLDTSQPDAAEVEVGPEDTADTADTDTAPEVVDPVACVDGLGAGACWLDEQCPEAWSCLGAAPGCTPCVDCPASISGAAGTCTPDSGADALGLLAWPPGLAQPERLYALFYIVDAFYTLLECPAFALEVGLDDGAFGMPVNEYDCSGVITPQPRTVIARPAPLPDPRTAYGVRARGRYRTGCFSSDPAACSGTVELTSNVVVLPP